MEIIEQIKKEYQEIDWGLDYTIERVDDKIIISTMELYYSSNLPRKFYFICNLHKISKELDEYLMLAKAKSNHKTEEITLNYDIINSTLGKDYNKHETSDYILYFIKASLEKEKILNYVNESVAFDSLDSFINAVEIKLNTWNDYGYYQVLDMNIWNESFTLRSNPHTPEMIAYMYTGNVKPGIDDLCTLGETSYYQFLKKYLLFDTRKEWFERINDLAFNLDELSRISEYYKMNSDEEGEKLNIAPPNGAFNNFFYNSFLRTTTLKEIEDVFHPLAIFGGMPEGSDIAIKKSVDEKIDFIEYVFEDKGEIVFAKNRFSFLPMNVYGIVGGNGSGKSFKINEIIKRHVENDNNFSQITHFSLSPFDNRIRYNSNGVEIELDDRKEDENENLVYEKVGFLSVSSQIIKDLIYKLQSLGYSAIENYVKDNFKDYLVDNEEDTKGIKIEDYFFCYIQILILDLIASEEKFQLWESCLDYFSFESWANDIKTAFHNRTISLDDFKKIKSLSSGQSTILLYLTKLASCINSGSLIIFDEPETFMHPPMMKSFIRAVSEIVEKSNAFCLVATHSPVIIQELPHCNVYKLDSKHRINTVIYKTYGQNLDSLYKNIYGVELQFTGYNSLLTERYKQSRINSKTLLYETDIEYLGDEAFLKYLLLENGIER